VNYSLPTATGFSSIQRNLDALIQNTGWEFMLNAVVIRGREFNWNSMITLSVPQNKLLKYPGLESSSDAGSYIIGEPLRVVQRFLWLGVDPATGIHQFADIDNDGSISPQFDYVKAGVLGPKYFGGIEQSITYKNWDFSFFCQFVKQTGNSYLTSLPAMPGELTNQPTLVMDRWQSQNQLGSLQRFSRGSSVPTRAYRNYLTSTAVLTDASFIRVKNIALAYNLISQKRKITGLTSCKVYLQAQDLITLTGYKGADPETQSVTSLPPLKTFVAGIQITF
jgi:hypothetical protein